MTTAQAIEYFENQNILLEDINITGHAAFNKALEALRLMRDIEEMKPLIVQAKQTAELDQMLQELKLIKPTICTVDEEVEIVYHPWSRVEDKTPDEFVSVLGHMTDAGEFPAVRECYLVGSDFFFPALKEFHPVDKWMEMPEP